MPTRHFLTKCEPLIDLVAAFLRETGTAGARLIVPTSSAAHGISQRLKAAGCEPPPAALPMSALLPEREDIAAPVERVLAWAEALRQATEDQLRPLFWKQRPQSTAELLKVGRSFNALADLLAEAALSPADFGPPTQPPSLSCFDESRRAAIATLYDSYLATLNAWRLHDPNVLRLRQISSPVDPPSRIVIACVPDLPRAFSRYASALEANNTQIDLLIWNPREAPANHFDDWGRPIPELWNSREISLDPGQIHVAASARDEASAAADVSLAEGSALVVADSALRPRLASELLARGAKPYLPEGTRLIRSEVARLLLEWEVFSRDLELRSLRRLLELPAFCRALDLDKPLSQRDALSAIDHLLGQTIAATLDEAWAASPALPETASSRERGIRARARRLLAAARALLRNRSALDLIARAFPSVNERLETVQRALAIGRQLEASPALSGRPIPAQVFAQAIRAEHVQSPAPEGAISLNGWLEAPWLRQSRLVICGCIEGRLPQSLDGDPFLPDSLRPALGLPHNKQRLARDAYLLDALLATRSRADLRLSFAKYGAEGDPNRPSRLLFATSPATLPARAQQLTAPVASTRKRFSGQTNWRWQLPEPLPSAQRISPTQFGAYLACPFRFCLKHVLRLDTGPQAAREMDAAVFGNLIHKTLENYALELIPTGPDMLRLDEATIRSRAQQLLVEEARRLFGPSPAPALRVQLASAQARLRAFARAQAACFAEGWVILEAERKLEADAPEPLNIGPLALSGVVDRIERHVETGALRVVDYKTFSSAKTPFQGHLGPASHAWIDAAQVEITSGAGPSSRAWENLQLPLCRKIVERWYPEACASPPPRVAYFALPSDPNETAILEFTELDENAYASAQDCAAELATRIADGQFWPPRPFRGNWADPAAPLLTSNKPEDSIDPETIARLRGGRR